MFFDKNKKPKASLETLTIKVLELEERLDSLVSLLQDDCPILRAYLRQKDDAEAMENIQLMEKAFKEEVATRPTRKILAYKSKPIPVATPEEIEEDGEELKRIIQGKPSKKAKNIIRI
jgi:hypothetical protein